jgi:phenylalanyl-tRNA synthetase beta chain
MKISENWLREWVSPKLDTQELADRLTAAGLEVGTAEPVAPPLANVVVGEIVAIAPHPQADRLRVCEVNVGERMPRTIVCGAANAAVGVKVPAALPGAVLPGGATIKEAKLRGVASAGMLCSASELGLEEESSGLLPLPANAVAGTPVDELLDLNDKILEVDLTPNRGDCLSIGGLARELSALTGVRVRPPKMPDVPAACERTFGVTVKANDACPRYVGRVIEGIDPQAETPLWMRERLRRCGQRSIGPVVDVTNYVMLELGQPMHAFDLATLSGGIVVRVADGDERLVLLDGKEVAPAPGTLLIADRKKPVALAGVMGGLETAVGPQTRNIFLESAYFAPEAIAGRARELGLQTESSFRFERGVDPALQRLAVERATALLIDIVGGRPGPVREVATAARLPARRPIRLRHARVEALIGTAIPAAKVERILSRLGMRLSPTSGGWQVTAPSHRFDISREADVIEEVARVHGYDAIPARLPVGVMSGDPVPESRVPEVRFRDALVYRDYQEAITYSFVDPELQRQLDPAVAAVELANPISADMAVMRTSLWPGLLQALTYNLNRQQRRVRLFEIGRVFRPVGGDVSQEIMIGGVACGQALPEQWGAQERAVDFYDVKADVEALLALSGEPGEYSFEPLDEPALHSGQAAVIRRHGLPAGRIGALHPALQANLGIDQAVFLFELGYESLEMSAIPAFEPVSRFPAIRRDLSVVLDEQIPARNVLATVARAAGGSLRKLELFDVYRGKGIDSKRKSLSFGLTLQDFSRTLRDEEIDEIVARVVGDLKSEFGADLR